MDLSILINMEPMAEARAQIRGTRIPLFLEEHPGAEMVAPIPEEMLPIMAPEEAAE